jgi:hypothetical protein
MPKKEHSDVFFQKYAKFFAILLVNLHIAICAMDDGGWDIAVPTIT